MLSYKAYYSGSNERLCGIEDGITHIINLLLPPSPPLPPPLSPTPSPSPSPFPLPLPPPSPFPPFFLPLQRWMFLPPQLSTWPVLPLNQMQLVSVWRPARLTQTAMKTTDAAPTAVAARAKRLSPPKSPTMNHFSGAPACLPRWAYVSQSANATPTAMKISSAAPMAVGSSASVGSPLGLFAMPSGGGS